jgi:hypothetical protein
MDRKLSLAEQAKLRLHLALCDACRSFGRQLERLRQAAGRLFEP